MPKPASPPTVSRLRRSCWSARSSACATIYTGSIDGGRDAAPCSARPPEERYPLSSVRSRRHGHGLLRSLFGTDTKGEVMAQTYDTKLVQELREKLALSCRIL